MKVYVLFLLNKLMKQKMNLSYEREREDKIELL